MDRNGNQGLVEAPGSLDHHQLLHILREKDNTIEKLKREVCYNLALSPMLRLTLIQNEDLNNRLKELSKGSNKKVSFIVFKAKELLLKPSIVTTEPLLEKR